MVSGGLQRVNLALLVAEDVSCGIMLELSGSSFPRIVIGSALLLYYKVRTESIKLDKC